MEVTRNNFLQILPDYKTKLEKAYLISFDLEMTGIRGAKESYLDLPYES